MAHTKSETTRDKVIQGALRALAQYGVTATTTRKIALESGVPLATLHYHFESKSALLLAVLDAINDQATASLRADQRQRGDLAGCIVHTLRAAWRVIERSRDLQIVQYELTMYALREEAGWLAEQQYDSYLQVWRDILLATAQRTGELDAAGCAALARFIFAGLDGLVLQDLARPGKARSRKGVEALALAAQGYAQALRREMAAPAPD
jgi:AcrR family transcriptional regulator